MAPRGFEDEELTISMSSTHVRRYQQPQPQQEVAMPPKNSAQAVDQQLPQEKKSRAEQRIGAYKVIGTLGEGSFGKVRLAIHNGTGQQVALKIIARKKLISRDMAGRVEREIEYLQLLRHPHIIKLYVVRSLNSSCLLMSYLRASRIAIPSSKPRPKSSWSSNTPAASCSTISSRTAG
jgi:carbon catabolite-derepressing protein kinase